MPPGDAEGPEVVAQFAAAAKHRREQFYNIAGNHDASGPDEPSQWWFKKWIDPEGRNPQTSGVDAASRRLGPDEPAVDVYRGKYAGPGRVLFTHLAPRAAGMVRIGGANSGATQSFPMVAMKRQVRYKAGRRP